MALIRGSGDVLDITTSGTASAPITFEAAPGQTPVINSSGSWNAINIEASYIVVSGFTVVGDAANYTLSDKHWRCVAIQKTQWVMASNPPKAFH